MEAVPGASRPPRVRLPESELPPFLSLTPLAITDTIPNRRIPENFRPRACVSLLLPRYRFWRISQGGFGWMTPN